jgi:predicted phage tail protein
MKARGWWEVILGILVIIFALITASWVKPALVVVGIIIALMGLGLALKK